MKINPSTWADFQIDDTFASTLSPPKTWRIRWADQRFSHRREYDQQVAQCMETLFQGVAQHPGVDVAVGGIRTRLQASLRCDVRSKDEVRFAFTEVTPLAVFEFSDRLHLRSIRTDN